MVSVREGGLLVRWCCRVRIKEDERRIEKQKNDFSVATKRLGRKFWVGHVFAKGKGFFFSK